MPFCGADAERDSHLSAAEEKRDGALSGRAATLSTRVAAVEARRTGLARLQTPSIGPEGTERLHCNSEISGGEGSLQCITPAIFASNASARYFTNGHHDPERASTYTHHMKDALFMMPTPRVLANVVDQLDAIDMADRDTKGDLYEYMLGKIASAGQNGQSKYEVAESGRCL